MEYVLIGTRDDITSAYAIINTEREITTEDIKGYVGAELATNFDVKQITGNRWQVTIHSRHGYDIPMTMKVERVYRYNIK